MNAVLTEPGVCWFAFMVISILLKQLSSARNPTVGSQIKKTRPCVIISPNEMNKYLKTIVLAPITTNLTKYPTRVLVNHNGKKGMIALDQIRTIDKSRIIKVFENLSNSEIDKCKEVIKETFVD